LGSVNIITYIGFPPSWSLSMNSINVRLGSLPHISAVPVFEPQETGGASGSVARCLYRASNLVLEIIVMHFIISELLNPHTLTPVINKCTRHMIKMRRK
jgi:hypothetical protein